MLCLSDATPTQLGPVVRALSPSPPWSTADDVLAVCLRAMQVLEVPPGSRVLLRVRTEDLDWLNIARPLFKERKLRTVLWADKAAHEGLIRRAIDFHDWVSRTVPVPAKAVPDFAVERLRSALARGAEIGWHGPGLSETLDAVGITERVEIHAEDLFLQMRATLSGRALPIVKGVSTPEHVWRIRLALDEVRSRSADDRRWVALDPDGSLHEFEAHDARQADWDNASAKLAAAGWRHGALLAAWIDLDPARLESAVDHVDIEPPSTWTAISTQTRDDDELRQRVAREIEEEVGQTAALLESLLGDGERDVARELANEWTKRAGAAGDTTTQSVAREWQRAVETRPASARPGARVVEPLTGRDRQAIGTFVDQNYDRVRRYIARFIPASDATDLTQQSFESIITDANESRSQLSRGRLFWIARDLIREHFRTRTREAQILEWLDPAEWAAAIDEPTDDLLDLPKYLEQLPFRELEVLLLRAQELSYDEIAEALGDHPMTARSRLLKARMRLRNMRDAAEASHTDE